MLLNNCAWKGNGYICNFGLLGIVVRMHYLFCTQECGRHVRELAIFIMNDETWDNSEWLRFWCNCGRAEISTLNWKTRYVKLNEIVMHELMEKLQRGFSTSILQWTWYILWNFQIQTFNKSNVSTKVTRLICTRIVIQFVPSKQKNLGTDTEISQFELRGD